MDWQGPPGQSTGQRIQGILRAEHTRVSTLAQASTPLVHGMPVLWHRLHA
jgi:hypothetical protein